MNEYICLSCKKVFYQQEPKCCGPIELFEPAKHGNLLVGNSNSWIDIAKTWKEHPSFKKVSEKLLNDGCYGFSTHINAWIEELLKKERMIGNEL